MSGSDWLFWALLSACFAAMTAIFTKIGVEDVDADLANLLRTVFILVVVAAFVAFTGRWTNPFALRTQTWIFLILSALATGASWMCYFRALQLGQASQVAPIDKLSVIMVALFGFLVLGERLSLREWAGIALIGLGALLLAVKRPV